MRIIKKALTVVLIVFYFNYSICVVAQSRALDAPLLPNTLQCVPVLKSCIDVTPCKTVNGNTACLAGVALPDANAFNISETCWEYQTDYSCLARSSDCLTLQSSANCTENKNSPQCALDGSGNPMMNAVYGCTTNTHTYTCIQTPASSTTTQKCDPSFNLNGLSWTAAGGNGTADFVNAVMGREIQGQIGKGLAEGIDLFAGEADKCQIKLGFKNCCQSGQGSGGGTNNQIASQMGVYAAGASLKIGAQYAVNQGSTYVFDSLMNAGLQNTALGWAKDAGSFTSGGVGAMGIGTTASAAEGAAGTVGGSLVTSSTVGISSSGEVLAVGAANAAATSAATAATAATAASATATAAAEAAAVVAEIAGTEAAIAASEIAAAAAVEAAAAATAATAAAATAATAASTLAAQAVLFINPITIGIAIAVMVVMAYLQCDVNDTHTANLVSNNLCHYVGSYCSQKVPLIGTCLTTKQSYCCYNGLLAKEIQEGAHGQLGLSWGSPESPSCGGLSIDQITALDFGSIDLSQFASQIQSSSNGLSASDMSTMQGNIATKLGK